MPTPPHFLSMAWYVLWQSMAFFGLALTSYILGRTLTRRLPYGSVAGEIAFSTGLGLGSLSTLALGLGLVELLYPSAVVVLVLLVHLVGHRTWRETIGRLRRLGWRALVRPSRLAAAALVALLLAVAFIMALYPPTEFDAGLYHLPQAAIFVESHGVPFSPELRYPVFPHLQQVLFAVVMLFWNDTAAALVQTLAMFLVALGIYAWGEEFYSPRVGLWAAALWIGSPVAFWFSSHAYADVGLAAFATLAVFAFAQWVRTDRSGWLVVSAALCGFGAATKYHGLFFVAAFALGSLAVGLKRRRFGAVGIAALTLFLVALPWYGRMYFHTGNPFFPMFSSVFGYTEWSLELARMTPQDVERTLATPTGSNAWWETPVQVARATMRGLAGRLGEFVKMPWILTFHPERLFGPKIPFSESLFFASPLLVVGLWRSGWVRFLAALVLIYSACWFATSPDERYLLYVLGLFCLAVAASIGEASRAAARLPRWLQVTLVTVLCLLFLRPTWIFAWPVLDWRGPIPVTEEQRQAYLEHAHPVSYKAIQFLNDTYGDQYRVFALGAAQLTHFAEGELIGDWFGPNRNPRIAQWVHHRRFPRRKGRVTAEGFYNELRSMDAGFFLNLRCRKAFKFPPDKFFRQHFELVFSLELPRRSVCVWQLHERKSSSVAAAE